MIFQYGLIYLNFLDSHPWAHSVDTYQTLCHDRLFAIQPCNQELKKIDFFFQSLDYVW